jgi:hypothetical protein
LGLPIVDVVDA